MNRASFSPLSPRAPASKVKGDELDISRSRRPARGGLLLGAGAIFILTLAAYLPVLQNGFIWDDDSYVTNNVTLRSLHGVRSMWLDVDALPQYYPLVHSTFWIEYHLWGLHPLGYHLDNVLLHCLNAVLLWRILRLLGITSSPGNAEAPGRSRDGGDSGGRGNVWTSSGRFAWLPGAPWVAAAAFALHPVCVESVAWVTERKNVLMLFFYLLSLWAYLQAAPLTSNPPAGVDHQEEPGIVRSWGWYALSLVFFCAAMLSKTVAASLPAAILILIWWKRGRWSWGQIISILPYLLLGVPWGLMTSWLETHHVGAEGIEWTLSPVQRLLIAGRALWFYAGKVAWPQPLSFIYERWDVDGRQWWQWLFPFAVLAVAACLWLSRRKIGRGPLAAVAFFAVTLLPALGFFNIYPMRYSFVADHFQYVAMIGLIVLVVGALAWGLPRLGPGGVAPAWGSGAIVLLALGGSTFAQTMVYHDLITLWTATIQTSPRAFLAYNNLGALLRDQGKTAEAFELFNRAIELKPNYYMAHSNLAMELLRHGDLDRAVAHLRTSLAFDPKGASSRCVLAMILTRQGKFNQAIQECQAALRSEPGKPEAHHALGMALLAQGHRDEGIKELRRAAQLGPDLAFVQHDLGAALVSGGDFDEGIDRLRRAVALDAHNRRFQEDLAKAVERVP